MGRCNCVYNRLRGCTTCLTDCGEQCEVHPKTRKQKMSSVALESVLALYPLFINLPNSNKKSEGWAQTVSFVP